MITSAFMDFLSPTLKSSKPRQFITPGLTFLVWVD